MTVLQMPFATTKGQRDSIVEKLQSIVRTATPGDRDDADIIITMAKEGNATVTVSTLQPAVCAILFLKSNDFNREWKPAIVNEYARRMSGGLWKYNGQSISFYSNTSLGDGQHRLAAAALAGYTFTTPIAFGVDPNDVTAIDNGTVRSAADHAAMGGVEQAARKETIIRRAANYFARVRPTAFPFDPIKSAAEMSEAIKKYDHAISQAMADAAVSIIGLADGQVALSQTEAATVAFVMSHGGWPADKVAHTLRRLQEGSARETEGGEHSPLFICREIVEQRTKGKTIAPAKQIGLIIKSAMWFASGEKASARVMRAEVEKQLPSPEFRMPAAA